MQIRLPRQDLLGEEKWFIFKGEGDREEPFPQWSFIRFNLQGNVGKAHQSLSGGKDQTIGNIQRTLRTYSQSGSVS